MNDDEKQFLEQIQKDNEAAHAETRRQFAEFAQAIQQRFDTKTAETRRHFDTVAEDIKKETHREIQLLAESLAHVDHKVDVNSAKIDRLAADNEIFKASFAHLDRRLRVVEDIVLPQKPS
jgi:tellurite resistance protein